MSNGRSFAESQSDFVRGEDPQRQFLHERCGVVVFRDGQFSVREETRCTWDVEDIVGDVWSNVVGERIRKTPPIGYLVVEIVASASGENGPVFGGHVAFMKD